MCRFVIEKSNLSVEVQFFQNYTTGKANIYQRFNNVNSFRLILVNNSFTRIVGISTYLYFEEVENQSIQTQKQIYTIHIFKLKLVLIGFC